MEKKKKEQNEKEVHPHEQPILPRKEVRRRETLNRENDFKNAIFQLERLVEPVEDPSDRSKLKDYKLQHQEAMKLRKEQREERKYQEQLIRDTKVLRTILHDNEDSQYLKDKLLKILEKRKNLSESRGPTTSDGVGSHPAREKGQTRKRGGRHLKTKKKMKKGKKKGPKRTKITKITKRIKRTKIKIKIL